MILFSFKFKINVVYLMLWNFQPNLKHRVVIFVTVKVWLNDFNNFVIYDKSFCWQKLKVIT